MGWTRITGARQLAGTLNDVSWIRASPVREIVTLEAVVQRVRAERIVAQPHQDVDDPDGDRGRHNHTERDRKPAHARHPRRKLL